MTVEAKINFLHSAIAEDVRTLPWRSNCAGEIFADDGSENGLRIGHFQGDAAIAAFVLAAHDEFRNGRYESNRPVGVQEDRIGKIYVLA